MYRKEVSHAKKDHLASHPLTMGRHGFLGFCTSFPYKIFSWLLTVKCKPGGMCKNVSMVPDFNDECRLGVFWAECMGHDTLSVNYVILYFPPRTFFYREP